MMWHPEIPLCLYFTASGCIEMRKFAWESWADVASKPNDTGAVAVLDGYQLLLTPFRYQVLPPPMSTFQLSLLPPGPSPLLNPRPPTHVAFSSCSSMFAVLFPNGQVILCDWHLPHRNPSPKFLSQPTEGFEAAVSGCEQALIVLFSESHGGKLRDGVLIQTFDVGNNQEHRGDNEASLNKCVIDLVAWVVPLLLRTFQLDSPNFVQFLGH
ncbi:hypothetical protein O181_012019 [Austropuccinia psidii MF-1]|uniref:ELP1 N-terminal second beta-propeller domain-containing protein n=1 Tax=Austropuccinia psidii MF-1 TaxID=1389203 RepID=A0A9Q3BTW0_9BASI|nr:hypothetical protein [Austropuccinia psidii MF-1]